MPVTSHTPRLRLLLAILATVTVGGLGLSTLTSSIAASPPCLHPRPHLVEGRVLIRCETGADGTVTGTVGLGPQAWLFGQRLDLNTCSQRDLERINGVGPSLAARLIAAREALPGQRFRSFDDVDGVEGVGPTMLAKLQAATTIP